MKKLRTSLLLYHANYLTGNFTIKPRVYWKRNQDMFLLKREDPSFYRNLHISNKVGFETNMVYNSKLGKTGFGIDVAKVYLSK